MEKSFKEMLEEFDTEFPDEHDDFARNDYWREMEWYADHSNNEP